MIPHRIPINRLIPLGYIFLSLTGYAVELKTVVYDLLIPHFILLFLCFWSLALSLLVGILVDQFFLQ